MPKDQTAAEVTHFDWSAVGLNFGNWEEEKIWALDLPVEEMDIEKLLWHLDIPYWENDASQRWTVTPRDVIDCKKGTTSEQSKTQKADVSFPIDVFENKGKFFVLDGLHRLTKLFSQGKEKINVRIIPKNRFHEIASENPIELPDTV